MNEAGGGRNGISVHAEILDGRTEKGIGRDTFLIKSYCNECRPTVCTPSMEHGCTDNNLSDICTVKQTDGCDFPKCKMAKPCVRGDWKHFNFYQDQKEKEATANNQ